MIEKGAPFIILAVLIVEGSRDDVAVAVSIHIAGQRDRDSEQGTDEVDLLRPRGRGGKPRSRTVIDVEAALARLGRRSCLREQTSRCPLGARCPAAARGAA